MQYLMQFFIAGTLAVFALVVAIILGGWFWLAAAILVPLSLGVFLLNRAAARRRPERRSTDEMNRLR